MNTFSFKYTHIKIPMSLVWWRVGKMYLPRLCEHVRNYIFLQQIIGQFIKFFFLLIFFFLCFTVKVTEPFKTSFFFKENKKSSTFFLLLQSQNKKYIMKEYII